MIPMRATVTVYAKRLAATVADPLPEVAPPPPAVYYGPQVPAFELPAFGVPGRGV
jgi:hypothetical protein